MWLSKLGGNSNNYRSSSPGDCLEGLLTWCRRSMAGMSSEAKQRVNFACSLLKPNQDTQVFSNQSACRRLRQIHCADSKTSTSGYLAMIPRSPRHSLCCLQNRWLPNHIQYWFSIYHAYVWVDSVVVAIAAVRETAFRDFHLDAGCARTHVQDLAVSPRAF